MGQRRKVKSKQQFGEGDCQYGMGQLSFSFHHSLHQHLVSVKEYFGKVFAHECTKVGIAFLCFKILAPKQGERVHNLKKPLLVSNSILFAIKCCDSAQNLPKRILLHERVLAPGSGNILLKDSRLKQHILLTVHGHIAVPFFESFGIQAYVVVEQHFLLHLILTVQFSLRGCIYSPSTSISASYWSFIILGTIIQMARIHRQRYLLQFIMNNQTSSIDVQTMRKFVQKGIISQEQIARILDQEHQRFKSQQRDPPKIQPTNLRNKQEILIADPQLRKSSSNSTEAFDIHQFLRKEQQEQKEKQKKRDQQNKMSKLIKQQQEIEQKIRLLSIHSTKSEQKQKQNQEIKKLELKKVFSAPPDSGFSEADQLDYLTAQEKEEFYRTEVMQPSKYKDVDQFQFEEQQIKQVLPLEKQLQKIVPPNQNFIKSQGWMNNQLVSLRQLNKNPQKLVSYQPFKVSIHNPLVSIRSMGQPSTSFNFLKHNSMFPLGMLPNRSRQAQIAQLANGPRLKILKHFGMINEIMCQMQVGFQLSMSWVLTAKNNVAKTIQFILQNGQLKIQLGARQISRIITDPKMKQILIIFQDPLRFFKKHPEIGWDRLPNLFTANLPQNQMLIYSLAFKKQSILIQVQNLSTVLAKIREVCRRKIEQANNFQNQFAQLPLSYISSEYAQQKFQKYFHDYTTFNPIKSWEIQFSLLSLLYNSNSIDLPALFQLASQVRKVFNPFLTDQVLKTAILLSGDSIQSELRQKKPLKEIFLKRLQQQKQSKNKGPSQNTIRVPIIKLTPSGYFPSGWNYDLRSRLTRHYRNYDHQFLKVEVADDDFRKSELYQCKDALKPTLQKLLSKIKLWGNSYIPLGWTQSQLKSKSMWFTLETCSRPIIIRQQLIRFLGDFDKFEKNPALKAARMGQNLSNGQGVVLNQVNYSCNDDDKPPGSQLMYTDGIGMISSDLVERIQKQLETTGNIFQIRYRGCKGMLVINRMLGKNTIIVRESMKKFDCPSKDACKYLDILAENSYGPGYLNRQIIILLSANHISTSTFIKIQEEFIDNQLKNKYLYENFGTTRALSNSWKTDNGFFQLESIGQIMNKIIKIKPELIASEPTLRGILTEKHHLMFERLMTKSQIKIEKSARLLGIIDEYQILQENEVYCQVTKPETEKLTVAGKAMLTKNPCMHQADIRVVTCISKQEAEKRFKIKWGFQNHFDELTNCIIFPKAGSIPLTAQISGSDLDGDEFYISWDERLIPPLMHEPNVLDAIKVTERKWNGVGYGEMIKFFCEYIFNNELGRLANSHLIHADQHGVDCEICLRLCSEYSKALDYPKKGYEFHFDKAFAAKKYPHWMQKPEKQTYKSASVLGKLFDHCKVRYEDFNKKVGDLAYDYYSFSKFNHLLYSDKQILSAYAAVEDYQYDIQKVMRNNQLERQSQVYSDRGARDKQRDNLLYVKNSIQRKYFFRFFEGLKVDNPTEYYDNLRSEKVGFVDGSVERKFMLWYQISNASIQKKYPQNQQLRKWITRLENLTKTKAEEITILGLPWLSLPFIAFLFACQQFI